MTHKLNAGVVPREKGASTIPGLLGPIEKPFPLSPQKGIFPERLLSYNLFSVLVILSMINENSFL